MSNDRITLVPSRPAGEARPPFVLVVDDEKRIADTLAAILASKGYAAKAAYDGASALESCREHSPDLLISDVVMPGMNGIELGIAVRAEFSNCRILLFSGQAATADMMEDAQSRGYGFDLLAKPVHPTHLLERVEQLIGSPPISATRTSSSPGVTRI